MKHPFDISNLDDEKYSDPTEREDYDDYYEDEFRTQHEVNCSSCAGTGEGTSSGTSCAFCFGRGYLIIKN